MHDLLLQKSGGTFELIVWNEKASGADDVTVNLKNTGLSARIFDPTTGISPTKSLAAVHSIPLTLSDHPVVIEISHAPTDGPLKTPQRTQ